MSTILEGRSHVHYCCVFKNLNNVVTSVDTLSTTCSVMVL